MIAVRSEAAPQTNPGGGSEQAEELSFFEVEVAPDAPAVFDPAEPVVPLPPPAEPVVIPEPEPEPERVREPEPVREPETEPEVVLPKTETEPEPDAGIKEEDAAPPPDAETMSATGPAQPDAAPVTQQPAPKQAGQDAGPLSGGIGAAMARASQTHAEQMSRRSPPPGASADLSPFAPPGDHLAVLFRLDRLRGTPWAGAAERIMAPMPDYRAIMGDRADQKMSELFDSMLISTSDPTDVIATNIAGHTTRPGEEIRSFLNHSLAPVDWVSARGGALGKRHSSPLISVRDTRVFLMPFEGWTVLTKPDHLGTLLEPRGGAIDGHVVSEEDLPEWLARVRKVEAQAGVERGPAIVMSLSGLPREVKAYDVTLPGPERVSLAISLGPTGLLVQGTMAFASPEQAEAFVTNLEETRQRYLDSRLRRGMLQTFHAYNALKNLWLSRNGPLVSYGTSISNADGKAMADKAAEISERFYGRRVRNAPPPREQSPARAQPPL